MDRSRIDYAHPLWLLRAGLIIAAILGVFSYIEILNIVSTLGYFDVSPKWRWGMAALGLAPAAAVILALLGLTRFSGRMLAWIAAVEHLLQRWGKKNWLLYLASLLLFSFLAVGIQPNLAAGFITRLFLVVVFGLFDFACLKALRPGWGFPIQALTSLLVIASVFRVAAFLPGITNYPLSIGWGESSNLVYASQFASMKLYGVPAPLPMINSGRALLGVVPYLLPVPQIWINRLWAALLWIGLSAAVAYLLRRRLAIADRWISLLFVLWASLFIFQGPIYYELLLSIVVVFWLFDSRHFWRSMAVVAAASLWIGICRINWFPMPGVAAAFIYLLEVPAGKSNPWRYLLKPAGWVVTGLACALASYFFYSAISGNSTTFAVSSMQSPLLWYRLFPNGTDRLGVLPTALIVALPSLLLIGKWWRNSSQALVFVRKLGLCAALVVFFAGGIVVSVKIGGGAGIHNLDAFWLLTLVLSSYLYFNRISFDRPEKSLRLEIPRWLTAALVALPVLVQLTIALPAGFASPTSVDDALNDVRRYVAASNQAGKDVLFIDNKQLLTFGYFPGTPTVIDYETVFMLEMAMSGNQSFYQKFEHDLKSQRFGVIITYPQPIHLQDPASPFSEENNAEIKYLGKPLLCYYKEEYTWLAASIEIFTPRPQPVSCP